MIEYGVNVELSWEEPLLPNGEIMGYKVFYSTNDSLPMEEWKSLLLDETERSARFEALNPETVYFFVLRAFNERGQGIESPVIPIQTGLPGRPNSGFTLCRAARRMLKTNIFIAPRS